MVRVHPTELCKNEKNTITKYFYIHIYVDENTFNTYLTHHTYSKSYRNLVGKMGRIAHKVLETIPFSKNGNTETEKGTS